TLGHFDAKRCEKWSVKAHAEAVVALQPAEIEIRLQRGDFSGIVEHCSVDEAVDHDPPLRLKDDPVLVAEPVARKSPQRRSASDVRQQKEGNLLIALGVRRLRLSAQRDDPGFPQYWNVLDRFVVDPPKTELFVRVGVIVQRDSVEPAASRIPWRRSPVDADSALRMHMGRLGAESRQRV